MEYHNTGLFALPGGFVKKDETLNNAVRRGLEERTGIKDIYLLQFHTFERFSALPTRSDGRHSKSE
jgi:8-oxo-dGTP diphosphatase